MPPQQSGPTPSCSVRGRSPPNFLGGFVDLPSSGRLVARAELAEEPGAGEGPIALGGATADPQGRGRLLDRQPGEQAELDQCGRLRVDPREPGDRLVQVDQVVGRGIRLRGATPGPGPGAGGYRPASAACGRAPDRSGCGASPRRRRRGSGRDCPRVVPRRDRPAGGTPRGPAPWPVASGRASPGPASARPAGAARRRPAAGAAPMPGVALLDGREDPGHFGHGRWSPRSGHTKY